MSPFELTSIDSEEDYMRACVRIAALGQTNNPDEEDELYQLIKLTDSYELMYLSTN